MKPAYVYIVVCLASLFLLACSSNVSTFDSSQSLGRQLDDLHKAYDANVLTETEYKEAKEILMDHYQ